MLFDIIKVKLIISLFSFHNMCYFPILRNRIIIIDSFIILATNYKRSILFSLIILFYYLSSLKSTAKTLGQQGTQANLNKGMVQAFRLALPTLIEQTAIATVLSDMDTELSALETRREKTRQLKQAMMQELLTGKTRLKPA